MWQAWCIAARRLQSALTRVGASAATPHAHSNTMATPLPLLRFDLDEYEELGTLGFQEAIC